MNYIELINRFWTIDMEAQFSPVETKLYFALLHIANRLRWKQPLSVPNKRLLAMVGCSQATLIRARQRLNDLHLIDYKKGSTRKAGKYYFSDYFNYSTNHLTNHETNHDTNRENLYKTKLNKTKDSSPNGEPEKSVPDSFNLSKYEKEIVETWESIVGPFNSKWKSLLSEALAKCYPAQIKNAIVTIAKTKSNVMKSEGFEYIMKPLRNGAFGRRGKRGKHNKRDKSGGFKNPSKSGKTTKREVEDLVFNSN